MDPMAMFPVDLSIDLSLLNSELMECKMRYRRDVWQVICDKALSLLGGGSPRVWRKSSVASPKETINEPEPKVSRKSKTPPIVSRRSQSPENRNLKRASAVNRKSRQSSMCQTREEVCSRRKSESPAVFYKRNSESTNKMRQSQARPASQVDEPYYPRKSTKVFQDDGGRKSKSRIQKDEPTPARKSTKKSVIERESRANKPTPKKSVHVTPSSESKKKKKTGEEDDEEEDEEEDDDDDDEEGEEEEETEDDDDADNKNNRACLLRQLSHNNRSSDKSSRCRRHRRSRRRKFLRASSDSSSSLESKESGMFMPDGSSFETSYSREICDRSYRSDQSDKNSRYRRSERSLSKRKKIKTPTVTSTATNKAITELTGLLKRRLGGNTFKAVGRGSIGSIGDVGNRLGSAACCRHKSDTNVSEESYRQFSGKPYSNTIDSENCNQTCCSHETCELRQKLLQTQQDQHNQQQLMTGDVTNCYRCNKPRR